MTISDAELVAACKAGNAWAWDALVEKYKRLVYSLPLRAGLSEEDAADIFQIVFSRLYEHLDNIREPQALAAWLITTTKRESWKHAARKLREIPLTTNNDDEAEAAFGLTRESTEETRLFDQFLVQQALEQLGGLCRTLLWMLYFDESEPTYEDASRRLGIPLGSIGPTRARCLMKMRRLLLSMGADFGIEKRER